MSQILPITKTAVKTIEAFTWKAVKAGSLEMVKKLTLWLPVERGGVEGCVGDAEAEEVGLHLVIAPLC